MDEIKMTLDDVIAAWDKEGIRKVEIKQPVIKQVVGMLKELKDWRNGGECFVDFETAIKAIVEGEKVSCVCRGRVETYHFSDCDELLEGSNCIFTLEQLLYGKWRIWDGEK